MYIWNFVSDFFEILNSSKADDTSDQRNQHAYDNKISIEIRNDN
jgi:hypothetical protein